MQLYGFKTRLLMTLDDGREIDVSDAITINSHRGAKGISIDGVKVLTALDESRRPCRCCNCPNRSA